MSDLATDLTRQRIIRRRRLTVARLLRDIVIGDRYNDAMHVWRERFDPQPEPDLFDFISQINDMMVDPGMEVEAIETMYEEFESIEQKAIRDARQMREDLVGDAPGMSAPVSPSGNGHGGPAPDPVNPRYPQMKRRGSPHPGYVVFNHLMQYAFRKIDTLYPQGAKTACAWVQTDRFQPGLSKAARAAEQGWLESAGEQQIFEGLNKPQLQHLVHSVYIWACENIGPVQADRIYAQGVEDCLTIKQAAEFDPRELL